MHNDGYDLKFFYFETIKQNLSQTISKYIYAQKVFLNTETTIFLIYYKKFFKILHTVTKMRTDTLRNLLLVMLHLLELPQACINMNIQGNANAYLRQLLSKTQYL